MAQSDRSRNDAVAARQSRWGAWGNHSRQVLYCSSEVVSSQEQQQQQQHSHLTFCVCVFRRLLLLLFSSSKRN